MVSVTEQTYLAFAANEASKSTLLSQHGCVAVANGKIIGRGHNSIRTQSKDGFICNTCSCHAEIAALRDVNKNAANTNLKYGMPIKGKKSRQ